MERFTYKYQGNVYDSTVEHYMQDDAHRFRVVSPDGIHYVIAIFGMGRPNGKIIWLQSNKPGEIVQPHELNQAIGEGLEESGLFKDTFDPLEYDLP